MNLNYSFQSNLHSHVTICPYGVPSAISPASPVEVICRSLMYRKRQKSFAMSSISDTDFRKLKQFITKINNALFTELKVKLSCSSYYYCGKTFLINSGSNYNNGWRWGVNRTSRFVSRTSLFCFTLTEYFLELRRVSPHDFTVIYCSLLVLATNVIRQVFPLFLLLGFLYSLLYI